MPIGWNYGDLGGATAWSPPPAPDPVDALDPWRHEPEPPAETGFWTWIEVDASTVYPVVWTRWATREDERVCPECGPLDGLAWPADEGPSPPLHNNCRCARQFAFVELSTRG